MIALLNSPPASRGLLYLATFGRTERAEINGNSELKAAIKQAEPSAWVSILDRHRASQRAAILARTAHLAPDDDGMRRQALSDLDTASQRYATLTDGRRSELFRLVCTIAKYVVHDVLTEPEVRAAFLAAAAANGATAKHGLRWAEHTITRALAKGRNDPLPPLARQFRSEGRS